MYTPNSMVAILAHVPGDVLNTFLGLTEYEDLRPVMPDLSHERGESRLIVFKE